MKVRSTPHTPALTSAAYPCGSEIHLLPGWNREQIALARAIDSIVAIPAENEPVPDDYVGPGTLLRAALVGLLWDDPTLELETVVPPDLASHSPETIVAVARMVHDEIWAARKLVLPGALLMAASKAVEAGHDPGN